MNPKFQRLKDLLYREWSQESILLKETSIGQNEWKEINDDPSRYFNKYIEFLPIPQKFVWFDEIPAEQRIWRTIEQDDARLILYKIIATGFLFEDIQAVPQAVAMRLVDDVIHEFSLPVLYICPYFSFSNVQAEERLVIIDQQKVLFVLRVEED